MAVLKNSGDSQHSERPFFLAKGTAVAALLALLVSSAAAWFYGKGYLLYYGDAQSHLNLSRSIIDSRTPGYDQLGTVWLPVLHLICLPFVGNNWLWSTGLAGTIPVALCFVFSGTCLYLTSRAVYRDWRAASVVTACFAINPNVLYLASIPLTELVFFAGLSLMLLCFVRFRKSQRYQWAIGGIVGCWWMSLTRYDGWFLIPFSALWFAYAARQRRVQVLILFGVLASLAPLYWVAHNWYETGSALDFYNGPYSAKAIQAGRPYPGYGSWPVALLYYFKAGQLCSGWMLVLLGIAGLFCAARTRTLSVNVFLCLTPLFYVWSIHSSGNPIHVPQLYPFSYYNTRYGFAVVALAAFASGAIVLKLGPRTRRYAALIPALAIIPWLVRPGPANWICWKESEVNSVSRRTWTRASTDYFQIHYTSGQGILTESGSGDLAGIFCRAMIPLRECLQIGNGPGWRAAIGRPDLAHDAVWALAQAGDNVSKALHADPSQTYRVTYTIKVKDAPLVEIFRRDLTRPLQP